MASMPFSYPGVFATQKLQLKRYYTAIRGGRKNG
jgi:hypothetical protein